eukprot:970986-Rhodomonas_salina.3
MSVSQNLNAVLRGLNSGCYLAPSPHAWLSRSFPTTYYNHKPVWNSAAETPSVAVGDAHEWLVVDCKVLIREKHGTQVPALDPEHFLKVKRQEARLYPAKCVASSRVPVLQRGWEFGPRNVKPEERTAGYPAAILTWALLLDTISMQCIMP